MTTSALRPGLVAGLALLAGCASAGAPRETSGERASSPDLRLTLRVEKASYELGEPVYVTAELRNTGHEAVAVARDLDPSRGALMVEIRGPGGPLRLVPLLYACGDDRDAKLAPEARVASIFQVFFGAEGWSFRRPGSYQIQATLTSSAVQAEPLSITIEAGSAAHDVTALLEGPEGGEVGKLLVWQAGDHLRKGIAALERFVEAHPEAALSQAALFVLGRIQGRPFKDFAENRVRPADPRRALELLQRMQEQQLGPYVRIQKFLLEARCHAGLGDLERARARVADARHAIGNAPEYAGLSRQADELDQSLEHGR